SGLALCRHVPGQNQARRRWRGHRPRSRRGTASRPDRSPRRRRPALRRKRWTRRGRIDPPALEKPPIKVRRRDEAPPRRRNLTITAGFCPAIRRDVLTGIVWVPKLLPRAGEKGIPMVPLVLSSDS